MQQLAGAIVTIQNATWSSTNTSTPTGFYEFDNLKAGAYTVSAIAPSHSPSASYSVTAIAGATAQQNIGLDSQYTLTVSARDSETGALLNGVPVFIQLSDGQMGNTTLGTATFAVNGGYITVTGTATGYSAAQQSASVTGPTTVTLLFYSASTQSQVSYYMQKQVRIKAVDAYGVPLVGSNITVNYISSSLPSSNVTWLVSSFGISSQVAKEMTNSGLAMLGTTAADGAVNFVMFPALTYGVTITNSTAGLSHYTTLSPQDNDYTIYCPLSSQGAPNSTQMQLGNTTLFITEPDINHVTFNLIYYDAAGLTSTVNYNVTSWDNMTPMYYITFENVGSRVVTDSNYTATNVRGQEWRFWYNATRSARV